MPKTGSPQREVDGFPVMQNAQGHHEPLDYNIFKESKKSAQKVGLMAHSQKKRSTPYLKITT
jgi:hypothetical protein